MRLPDANGDETRALGPDPIVGKMVTARPGLLHLRRFVGAAFGWLGRLVSLRRSRLLVTTAAGLITR